MIVTRERALDSESSAFSDVVLQAIAGEPRAFRRLMATYQDAFYGLARRFTGTHEDADDVLQDAFLKIHHNLSDLERPEAFFPWARRILVNTALDHIRKQRRASAVEVDPGEGLEERAESDAAPPDRRVEEREFFGKVDRALRVLPPRQREVVLLHDIEGYSTEEISEQLEIPRATVRSNLFYGREKLRRMLGRYR